MVAVAEFIDKISNRKSAPSSFIMKDKMAIDDALGYQSPDLSIDSYKRLKKKSGEESTPSGNVIMTFDGVMTTSKKDRDGDVLVTSGGKVDPKMPLLWCHGPEWPVGALDSMLVESETKKVGRFRVAATELGMDTATLIEIGALRLSIGFKPNKWEDITTPEGQWLGWKITDFLIIETSVVPVPANEDAIILAFQRKSFKSATVRSWANQIVKGSNSPLGLHVPGQPIGQKRMVIPDAPKEVIITVDSFQKELADSLVKSDPVASLEQLKRKLLNQVFVVETAIDTAKSHEIDQQFKLLVG